MFLCIVLIVHLSISDKPFISKWLFDVELIFRLKKLFLNKDVSSLIYELPLTEWKDVAGSKLKFRDFLKAPIDLLKIHFTYHK